MSIQIEEGDALRRAGKYLTFAVGNEEYGVEILKVREIIGVMDITAVPRMPDYVRGVMNLRGQVIPVIDLRARFDMPQIEATARTCIVVVETTRGHHAVSTGIVVDGVSEVLDIAEDQIEDAPKLGTQVRCDFVQAMGKIGTSVKILLNIDAVLGDIGAADEFCSQAPIAEEVCV